MESNKTVSSATSTTITISKSKATPVSTAHGKILSDANPTLSTPTTVPTSVVQKYVSDAANMISSSPATRRLFLTHVTKMCLERAKETGNLNNPLLNHRKLLNQLLNHRKLLNQLLHQQLSYHNL